MKKGLVVLFIVFIVSVFYFNYSLEYIDAVSIKTDANSLNGFVYSSYDNFSYIVTCFHGVCDEENILVDENQAKLINHDPVYDLALLKVDRKIQKVRLFKKIDFDNLYINHIEDDKIIKKEGKMIDDNILIHNSITYQDKQIDYDLNYLCIDIDCKKGYSGSPIYSTNNKIIGMVVMKDDSYCYGIKYETIKEKIDSWIKGECAHD